MVEAQVRVGSYALVTAAYNEEKYIARALDAITAQTVKPKKWIIVDDGSNDQTAEIVRRYAKENKFIELCQIAADHPRNLTAQVHAINKGFSLLRSCECEFIGNLDADISCDPKYFERLLDKFSADSQLGLAGGSIYEEQDGRFQPRRGNNISSVAHAVQLFRRVCLIDLGGYKPFSWAGADWHAEVSLRMKGWRVQSFPDLRADHHRRTGKGFGLLRYWYHGGLMDHYIGTHPLFELFRLARRVRSQPFVIGAVVRLMAFGWATITGAGREVTPEFMYFLREEQMRRLKSSIRYWFRYPRRSY